MPALGNRLTDRSWIIKEISEINSEDHTSGGAEGDPESSATALQAFASFCCTVRNHTESGLASSRKPRDALSNILQAADRCPISPTNAPSHQCASCKWAEDKTPSLPSMHGALHSASPAHSLSMQLKVAVLADTQCARRVRDENMPEMGFWLDDCAEGSWLPWFIIKMSAVEQREVRNALTCRPVTPCGRIPKRPMCILLQTLSELLNTYTLLAALNFPLSLPGSKLMLSGCHVGLSPCQKLNASSAVCTRVLV